ncbi:hypothetical protein BO70DRAFT_297465 [Aspergillus heteromorphus CBS 117.55]|uniref:LysM domain-containing protein n=1 Tax=Aspergillus heteromorphus CBS 117.55 TaxID=1448321 RepID=A0A317VIJ2_9EURO|nr:uncharacterized protein BO70DRAFT_297465 [Aspergillus heteromorphus CBS 117.55]PWY73017.1 hypothetical protein BO70DRAFT_297465 [Aspergillus heteromorphus CBS 117.55]
MGSLPTLLLAVASCFIPAEAVHFSSHGYLHAARHHHQSRTVDPSVSFPGLSMFPNGSLSGLDLSSACEDALSQKIYCDETVSSLITDDYIGSFDNSTLTALVCASSCGSSIAELHESVSASCGTTADLIPGISFLALVDELWSNWNQSCITDPTTGENCNDEIASFDNVTALADMATSDLCSYCYVKKLEMMQEDAFSDAYNDDFQFTYEYVAASCNLTVADFNATASAFNASVPTSTSSCVSGDMYTTVEGDTCDSIALAKGVSAATMYYTNPNIVNCSDILAGTTLCLPLSCTDLYSVKANDTCTSIAVDYYLSTQEVINWNSQLNWNCSNLHSTNPYWGSVLCVSPPGGTYTGHALNTTASDSTEPEAAYPPAGVKVAPGTTLDCGGWFVNSASLNYTCSEICLYNDIPIHLFTAANPSLNYTTCNSDLVAGYAYCIDPLTGWQYSNATATNSTAIITAATSPTEPTQTGIPANCDAYYVAQCTCKLPITFI